MKGTRPLNNAEIHAVAKCFEGTFATRNRALFMLGVSIGGRIDELLSLRVGDVWQNGKPVTDVLYDKAIVKGGEVARAVPLNADGRQAIREIMKWHTEKAGLLDVDKDTPLFVSRVRKKDGTLKRMTTQAGSDAIMAAFDRAGLNGKLGTHSMRKSFAQRLYSQTNDIFVVQEMLGHKNVATTQKYLGVNYAEVREALELMSINVAGTEEKQATPVYRASDDSLIAELAKRGYMMSSVKKEASPNGEGVGAVS